MFNILFISIGKCLATAYSIGSSQVFIFHRVLQRKWSCNTSKNEDFIRSWLSNSITTLITLIKHKQKYITYIKQKIFNELKKLSQYTHGFNPKSFRFITNDNENWIVFFLVMNDYLQWMIIINRLESIITIVKIDLLSRCRLWQYGEYSYPSGIS